ncbi:hypothetical protein HYH02_009078 [Chlamydomonas schloesseri]|uniref:Kinesin motor domain-containing protein n=1 Tax=Chlamydomonas schloesseri TaxID=2026947 RepID=A0A835WB37_9CHLO|nr:hypothetical protein HYH02_009078 [Chlamydomonas schloesseri]|eukprot:KAG2444138.1 hypothetical protein HYH02_009078 [Chlamydomonas schloesseri]
MLEALLPAASPSAEESNVCVAVKIRPLVPAEVDDGCRETLFVTPGLPQISTGQHNFTYDHVFGEEGASPDQLYPRCVAPLVAGLFKGYNATVFAYGQTGSGKTYTMGSEYKPGGKCRGVIPDAINDIFSRIEASKDSAITVRVSFVEIHKEEIKDLLMPATGGPRPAITIRETQSGGVALYGAVEREVHSREEMAEVLEMGTLCRSTASTNMNNRSSRSHAIFSITLEQRRQVAAPGTPTHAGANDGASTPGGDDEGDDEDDAAAEEGEGLEDYLCAKMHLVDLAGSERAKRTKAEGARLREGIHINRGLLALGNVINAIVDNHKHVPYRDSKLTRLLQDSLGGNSRTVMIACVSPADSNFEESLNTLRYADRARHIRNKPVVNRDPIAAQLALLRSTIAQLKGENISLRRALAASGSEEAMAALAGRGSGGGAGVGGAALDAVVERLTQENNTLESENMRLKMEMDDLRQELLNVTDRWHTAQAQCDLLRMSQAAAARSLQSHASLNGQQGGASSDGANHGASGLSAQQEAAFAAAADGSLPLPGLDIVKGYVSRIAELEAELKSMKSLAHLSFARRRHTAHGGEPRTPGGDMASPGDHLDGMSPGGDGLSALHEDTEDHDAAEAGEGGELAVEEEYFMAELAAHTLNQEKMKKEVALLQRQLEAKERKMVELMKNAGSMPALKQHYDRVLAELESQRDTLVAERKSLMEKLAQVSAANEEERKRLEAQYRDRIQQFDEKLRDLRRKERDFIAMQKLKQRTEEAHRRLSADILRLKQQKVAVQKQLDANAKQFATWRQEREKELAQLRKQSRKDRATIQHLEAMQAKQSAVLQRKISDANAARKRIKELEDMKRRQVVRDASSGPAQQQQAAAVVATQQALGGTVEMQPNIAAPVLRTDKDRREWLQKELELCNMSSEFRKVIDGELAQRAEASRKLKELEKRLTLLDQLSPSSPLLLAGSTISPMTPLSPATAAAAGALAAGGGAEARQQLLAKKKELEDKVAYHNAQISDLQAQWERQKAEEEGRGGGALDVRRWAGLRNVVECRELLRTLFRLLVESKCLSNDLTVDMVRYGEEVDVLRVQLEGATKKAAQYRKLATALQAAAAHVATAQHHTGVSAQDETDKQVDAVLEELHVVRTAANTPAAAGANGQAAGLPNGGQGLVAITLSDDLQGLQGLQQLQVQVQQPARGGGGGAVPPSPMDVDMDEAGTPGTPDHARAGGGPGMEPKALEFLSPVPSNGRPRRMPSAGDGLSAQPSSASQRYSPDHDDSDDDEEDDEDTAGGRHSHRLTAHRRRHAADDEDAAMDDPMDADDVVQQGPTDDEEDEFDEEDEEEDESEDDDEDDDWDPAHATPAIKGRGSRRTSSSRVSAQIAGEASGSMAAAGNSPEDDEAAAASGKRALGGNSRRRTLSMRRSGSVAPNPEAELVEGPVLDDINLKRYAQGHQTRLTKLTVAVLKDALKGQVIDGQKWHAGSKNRAQLISDYRRLLGLTALQHQQHLQAHQAEAASEDGAQVRRSVRNGSAGGEISIGGAGPFALHMPTSLPEPGRDSSDAFTFSPHVPTAAGAPGTAALAGAAAPSPAGAVNSRRPTTAAAATAAAAAGAGTAAGATGGVNGGLGPWARSSLNAASHSARQAATWASTLRSSYNLSLPADGSALGAAPAAAGGLHLTRMGSGSALQGSGGSGSLRGSASGKAALGATATVAAEATTSPPSGGLNSARRLQACGSGSGNHGAGASLSAAVTVAAASNAPGVRDSLDYRGAILTAPVFCASPRVPKPPGAIMSPRNSPGTPPSPPTSGGRVSSLGRHYAAPTASSSYSGSAMKVSPGPLGAAWTASLRSGGSMADGGENMQPPQSTTPGSGKGTPLTNLYKEKAEAARQRTAALRVSMQRNWDQQQQGGGGGNGLGGSHEAFGGGARLSGGATGAVTSSMDGGRGGAGGLASLRDSSGSAAAAAAAAAKKAIWR